MSPCQHRVLSMGIVDPAQNSYRQPGKEQIQEALNVSRLTHKRCKKSNKLAPVRNRPEDTKLLIDLPPASTFPAPIVVPGDELFHDPEYPPQSVQEWMDEEERNQVTSKRRTFYVVAPSIADEVSFVKEWSKPETRPTKGTTGSIATSPNSDQAQQPRIEDIAAYLAAFYHGMRVKILEKPKLEFAVWDTSSASKPAQNKYRASTETTFIGLSDGREAIRIRCRRPKDGVFSAQMNLNDLLDAAISNLPTDAYALLMLVHQDLYESDDDDFCCGRAYVSSYCPALM